MIADPKGIVRCSQCQKLRRRNVSECPNCRIELEEKIRSAPTPWEFKKGVSGDTSLCALESCRKPFKGLKHQIYCCETCSATGDKQKRRLRYHKENGISRTEYVSVGCTQICALKECSKSFVVVRNKTHQKYCTDTCSRKAYRMRKEGQQKTIAK